MTTFEPGRFDDIPLFPRSNPVGPRADTGATVARSFRALGTTPAAILEFYRSELADEWTSVDGVKQLGVGTYRADWVREGYRLRVSATSDQTLAPEDNASGEVAVQYSLTLEPL